MNGMELKELLDVTVEKAVKEFADKLKQKARGLKYEDGEGRGFIFENILLTSDIDEILKDYEK